MFKLKDLVELLIINYVILNRYKCEIFQIDGRTKWWNRSAQEKKKETMKEREKKRPLGVNCLLQIAYFWTT
jgi:hypothetical protein